MTSAITPFTFINSINGNKTQPYSKEYVPFITARTMSYFPDTLVFAQLVNEYQISDPQMHYQMFLSAVRPRKRFAKWAKPTVNPDVETLSKYFNLSRRKIEEIIDLFTADEIKKIYDEMKVFE